MTKVGFVGLGNVGLPAAVNLLKAGFEVHGYDVRVNKAFATAGGTVAATLADIASCPVIVQSLPSPAALTIVR